jgi:1-pyrroline-5-carboxylate dehydrogenase
MEMGGNNPALVMPSADLEDAAEGILRSAFAACGQQRSACSRVYVHQQICRDFLELFLERIRSCQVGPPQDPDTCMGPLISKASVAAFERAVRIGKRNGRLLWGGHVLSKGPFAHGHFVEPTVIELTRKNPTLLKEHCPVPVLAVTEVKSLSEALALANGTPFGLTAGIFTRVEAEQEQFFEQIEAGTAFCNRRHGATSGARPGAQSFGGWKGSGSTGKNALGPYYMTQFMREQSRTVCW